MKRVLRIGCWTFAGAVCAGVQLLVILYAVALGATLSPEARPRKVATRRNPPGLMLPDGTRLVTVQGMPFPVPEESARGAIVMFGWMLAPLRRFGDTAALGRGYAFLATLNAAANEREEAERLFAEAIRILKKCGDANANDLAWVHINQALVRMNRGQYTDAIRSFEAAMAAGPDPLLRVAALSNEAGVYLALGDPAQSERHFLGALDLLRTMGERGTFADQTVRSNFAVFYEQVGDLDRAQPLLEKLATEPGVERLGRLQVLNNLAYLYAARKQFVKAEATFAQAEALTWNGSEVRAALLANRTMMLNRAGRFEHAERVGGQAYQAFGRRFGEDSIQVAAVLTELGIARMRRGDLAKAKRSLARASAIFETEPDKEFLAASTRLEAVAAQEPGDEDGARRLGRRALDLAKWNLDRILAFGTESQRLAYLSEAAPFDPFANMGMPDLLADAVLTFKGAVRESLLAERAFARAGSAADGRELDAINQMKVELLERIAAGDDDTKALERELKRRQTALAQRLALHFERTTPRATVQNVQAKLDPDQVFVDIVRYQRYAAHGDVVAYGAVIIPPAGPPAWVPLADGAQVEAKIADLVQRYGGGRGTEPERPHGNVVEILRDLHDAVWLPLAKAFPPGTRRVLLSPDGALCFVPWGALLEDRERFLAERFEVTQIGSGRDLLRPPQPSPGRELLAFGDGANDLAHSRDEIQAIESTARRHGWTVTSLLGAAATERMLALHPQPRILHIATHAGRLRSDTSRSVETRMSVDPMSRGYVLLGGGSETLGNWDHGRVAPFASDGILTAEEASALDLRNTWLTVLSACHSGAGDARAGDGVMGLRRGFALAGTENLLLALWAVEDDAGAAFMKDFYVRVFRTNDPVAAFHRTQRAELVRWKRLEGVEAAARQAGVFVIAR